MQNFAARRAEVIDEIKLIRDTLDNLPTKANAWRERLSLRIVALMGELEKLNTEYLSVTTYAVESAGGLD